MLDKLELADNVDKNLNHIETMNNGIDKISSKIDLLFNILNN